MNWIDLLFTTILIASIIGYGITVIALGAVVWCYVNGDLIRRHHRTQKRN